MAEYVSVQQHVAVLNGLLVCRWRWCARWHRWRWLGLSLSGGYGGALAVVVRPPWWGYGRWCRRSGGARPIIGLFGRHAQPRTFPLLTPPRRPIPP